MGRRNFLNDPGTQIVSSGGTAAGVVISGGEQDVFGSAVGTIVTAGQQSVSRGGLASGTTLGVGGAQRVASGGTANGTTIEFGGTAVIQSGGTLGAATSSGGALVLSAGVLLNGGVSVPADGTLVIGGTAIPAHLLIGGFGAGDQDRPRCHRLRQRRRHGIGLRYQRPGGHRERQHLFHQLRLGYFRRYLPFGAGRRRCTVVTLNDAPQSVPGRR